MTFTKAPFKLGTDTAENTTAGSLSVGTRKLLIIVGIIVFCAVSVVIGSAFLTAQKKASVSQMSHTPVLTVSVQAASIQPIERTISTNGSVSAWDPISVAAPISGLQITSVAFEEGTTVKKGQVLATLDRSVLDAQLESEKARLRASTASISKSIQPNRPEDINGLAAAVSQAEANVHDQEAGLIQAKANLMNAQQNAKRYQFLREEGAISAQDAETRATVEHVATAIVRGAEEKVRAAQFVLKQARERLALARIGGRREDIQIARANAAEIRGNIKRLEAQIAQTIIKAPVDGLITKRDAHIGDMSTVGMMGKTLFQMARDSRIELKAQVPESDLLLIKPGQSVTIKSSLLNDGPAVRGRVREISPLVDSDTRLATVRIDLPYNCGLKAGMYVEGQIAVGKNNALAVPSQSVISRDDQPIVFVLHGSQVQARRVVTGSRFGDMIEIKSGLVPSETVVVDGAGFLKDGDYVAVGR